MDKFKTCAGCPDRCDGCRAKCEGWAAREILKLISYGQRVQKIEGFYRLQMPAKAARRRAK